MSWNYSSNGSVVTSASATTLTPTAAAGSNNQIQLAAVAIKSNATISTATSGWTKLFQQDSGANFTYALFIANPSAANPVFTWTGAVACAAVRVSYGNAMEAASTNAIGASALNSGSGTTHSASSINTTRRNSMVVYCGAVSINSGSYNTPSGWTEDAESGASAGAIRFVFGSKPIDIIGDPSGAISITGPNGSWVLAQIELRVLNNGSEFQFYAINQDTAVVPADGFQLSAINQDTMITPELGFSISGINFDILIGPGTYPSLRRRPLYIS